MTDKQPEALQYANRDSMALGEYYLRHISAMTSEALHAKSAIAAELAHRDREIDCQHAELETLRAGYEAARLEIESLRARCVAHAGEYPALPVPVFESWAQGGLLREAGFTADQMRAYVDADRAMRAAQPDLNLNCKSTQKRLATLWGFVPAQPTPQQEAQEPVAAWMTPEGDRVVTKATMDSARRGGGAMLSSMRPYTVALVPADAPTPLPSPAAQEARAMTDTTPVMPTDDEIDAVVQTCRERGLRELDVFRAVLAKWSTPTAGEPMACEPLIRQMRDALSLPCDRWNATQSRIVREAIKAADAWLEGKK